jgi:hypothetical protein
MGFLFDLLSLMGLLFWVLCLGLSMHIVSGLDFYGVFMFRYC